MTSSSKIENPGRPSKYKAQYAEDLVPLMEQGYTQAKLCAKWRISRETFRSWCREYPDFDEAYKIGKEALSAWLQDKGMKMVDGKIKGDSKVWSQFMRNVDSEWDPKEDKQATQISIGNMNILQQKDVPELNEILMQKLNKLAQYQPELRNIELKPNESESDE